MAPVEVSSRRGLGVKGRARQSRGTRGINAVLCFARALCEGVIRDRAATRTMQRPSRPNSPTRGNRLFSAENWRRSRRSRRETTAWGATRRSQTIVDAMLHFRGYYRDETSCKFSLLPCKILSNTREVEKLFLHLELRWDEKIGDF